MTKYRVDYSEAQIRSIVVDADSREEAERMVLDGDVDYDLSVQEDATIIGVNSTHELEGE